MLHMQKLAHLKIGRKVRPTGEIQDFSGLNIAGGIINQYVTWQCISRVT